MMIVESKEQTTPTLPSPWSGGGFKETLPQCRHSERSRGINAKRCDTRSAKMTTCLNREDAGESLRVDPSARPRLRATGSG